jgi:hypothetical protein
MIGFILSSVVSRIPSSLLSSIGLNITQTADLTLFFISFSLQGLLGIFFFVDRRLIWNASSVILGVISVVLAIRSFVGLADIPHISLIFSSLIIIIAAEIFSLTYFGIERLMLKSRWRG